LYLRTIKRKERRLYEKEFRGKQQQRKKLLNEGNKG